MPFPVTSFARPDFDVSPDLGNAELGVAATRLVLTVEHLTGNVWMRDHADQ